MHKMKVPSTLARAGKVDIRVDEEQNAKLCEIIGLLVEAGYFRAKIKGLSPFDKIIGGMTWCIEGCNFDVDVDLLFHDSLSIGQKIALTEQIVKVLPSMKCPHRIEPHQIQGLDAIHIFPVMKWLVIQAAETRAEYQDEIRIIALDEFTRQYSNSLGLSDMEDQITANLIRKLKVKYGPRHRFRRKPGKDPQTENANVLLTLLEYSEVGDENQVMRGSATEFLVEGEAEDLHQTLTQALSIDKQTSSKLSSKCVSVAISEQVKDIASTTHHFHKNKKEDESTTLCELISVVEKQKSDLQLQLSNKDQLLKDREAEGAELRMKVEETQRRFEDLRNKIKESEVSSDHASKENIDELGRLVEANEAAKKRIFEFKESCRREVDSLEKKIEGLKITIEEKKNEAIDQSLIELCSSENERLSKFRSQLAKKAREVELYKRLVDDIPGRAELAQYQRRFVELYNLVGAEHHETLQFYSMYNTLADSKSYMEKELGLLNSILDNMDQGLATAASLGEYIHQLDSIIEGIKQSKLKLEQKRTEVQVERSGLSQEMSRLQELQLLYAKHIYLFSQEIAKNEILLREVDSKT